METSKRLQKRLDECKEQIMHQFDIGMDGIRAKDRALIEDASAEIILKKSIYGQQQWLKHIKTARGRYMEDFKDEYDAMRSSLCDWLE